MADCSILQGSLNRFLQIHYEDYATSRRTLLQRAKTVLEALLHELRKREKLFDFESISGSTCFDVKASNFVEVVLCLNRFDTSEEGLSIEDGQTPPGFAIAKINSKKTAWDEWCVRSNSGKKFLSSRDINEKLLEHIEIILNLELMRFSEFTVTLDRSHGEHAVTLKLSAHAQDYYVSLLPTIHCVGRWPFSAHAWQGEESYWPSKKIKQEAVSVGIHLVGRSPRTKSPYHWQIAFYQPIKRLLSENTGCAHNCLMLMKIYLENKPDMQSSISGAHLEILMLHLLKKFPVATFWREDKFAQRFLDFVNEMIVCIQRKELQDFILPDVNLFKDLSKSAADELEIEVKELQADPVEHLESIACSQQDTAL